MLQEKNNFNKDSITKNQNLIKVLIKLQNNLKLKLNPISPKFSIVDSKKFKEKYKKELLKLRKSIELENIDLLQNKKKKILSIKSKVKRSIVAAKLRKKRLKKFKYLNILENIKEKFSKNDTIIPLKKKILQKTLIKKQVIKESKIKKTKINKNREIKTRLSNTTFKLFNKINPVIKTDLTAYYTCKQKEKRKYRIPFWKKKYLKQYAFVKKIKARLIVKAVKKANKIKNLRNKKYNNFKKVDKKKIKPVVRRKIRVKFKKQEKPRVVRQSFRRLIIVKKIFRFKNYVFLFKERKRKKIHLAKELIKRNPRKFARIFVNITRKNYFLTLTDKKNKVITKISSGVLGYKGRHRAKQLVGKRIAGYLAKNAVQKGFNIIDIYFVNKIVRLYGEITKSFSQKGLFIVISCFIIKNAMDLLL